MTEVATTVLSGPGGEVRAQPVLHGDLRVARLRPVRLAVPHDEVREAVPAGATAEFKVRMLWAPDTAAAAECSAIA